MALSMCRARWRIDFAELGSMLGGPVPPVEVMPCILQPVQWFVFIALWKRSML